MSKNIKLTSRYTVFVIYDEKSHYTSTYNVLRKKQSYVRRIYVTVEIKIQEDWKLS